MRTETLPTPHTDSDAIAPENEVTIEKMEAPQEDRAAACGRAAATIACNDCLNTSCPLINAYVGPDTKGVSNGEDTPDGPRNYTTALNDDDTELVVAGPKNTPRPDESTAPPSDGQLESTPKSISDTSPTQTKPAQTKTVAKPVTQESSKPAQSAPEHMPEQHTPEPATPSVRYAAPKKPLRMKSSETKPIQPANTQITTPPQPGTQRQHPKKPVTEQQSQVETVPRKTSPVQPAGRKPVVKAEQTKPQPSVVATPDGDTIQPTKRQQSTAPKESSIQRDTPIENGASHSTNIAPASKPVKPRPASKKENLDVVETPRVADDSGGETVSAAKHDAHATGPSMDSTDINGADTKPVHTDTAVPKPAVSEPTEQLTTSDSPDTTPPQPEPTPAEENDEAPVEQTIDTEAVTSDSTPPDLSLQTDQEFPSQDELPNVMPDPTDVTSEPIENLATIDQDNFDAPTDAHFPAEIVENPELDDIQISADQPTALQHSETVVDTEEIPTRTDADEAQQDHTVISADEDPEVAPAQPDARAVTVHPDTTDSDGKHITLPLDPQQEFNVVDDEPEPACPYSNVDDESETEDDTPAETDTPILESFFDESMAIKSELDVCATDEPSYTVENNGDPEHPHSSGSTRAWYMLKLRIAGLGRLAYTLAA